MNLSATAREVGELKSLHLSPDLKLPLDVAGEAIGILATRGAGKSYASAVLIEELHEAGVQFAVLDAAGVFWGLRAGADGKSAGIPVFVLGGAHGDVPLEPTAGALIADLLVDTGQSLILDLSDFPSKGAKTRFVTDFAERLYIRKSRARTTLHLVIDEAHEFAPQKPQPGEARMLGAVEHLIRGGRSRGIGATLITQRSAALNKTVLDLIETLIAMRVLSPRDRKVVDDWITHKDLDDFAGEQLIADLPKMKTGTAWVWSPVREILKFTAIRRIRTFDSYATPKPGEKRIEPTRRAEIDITALGEQMKATAERAKENDPKALRSRITELERELAKKPAAAAPKIERVEVPVITDNQLARLEKALSDLNAGAEKHSKAMAALWSSAMSGLHDLVTAVKAVRGVPVAMPTPQRIAPPAARRISENSRNFSKKLEKTPGDSALTGPEQKILDAIAWLNAMKIDAPDKTQVGLFAEYSPTSGGYANLLSKLRTRGLIDYPRPGVVVLTETGAGLARDPDLPRSAEALHERIRNFLSAPHWKVLEPLLQSYPNAIAKDHLAETVGYSATSGGYANILSRLRTLGLVDYPDRGQVVARGILFP